MPLIVIGLSHHTSPVHVRERFAFAEARIPATLELLRTTGVADEAVILSTCNRVEMYAATTQPAQQSLAALREFLVRCHDYRDPLTDEIYSFTEPQSIEHLFKVACGLDSMVLGETEILGQLKRAYDLALQHGHTGGRLNKVFQRAFNAAKHIRASTNIQRGNVSVGSVAVELAETGVPVAGTIAVHGSFRNFTPAAAKNIKGRVLILHGAEDPVAPMEELNAVISQFRAAKVDF